MLDGVVVEVLVELVVDLLVELVVEQVESVGVAVDTSEEHQKDG